MASQRQTDDYWQAYWGERFKSENEGYQNHARALEAKLKVATDALRAIADDVSVLRAPGRAREALRQLEQPGVIAEDVAT